MKKLLVILILFMYGAASFGMTVHFHYCCGQLDSVDFTVPEAKHCNNDKHQEMDSQSCCDSKELKLAIQSDQNPGKILQPSFESFPLALPNTHFIVSAPVETKNLIPEIFAPPPLTKDITHFYCIYRI